MDVKDAKVLGAESNKLLVFSRYCCHKRLEFSCVCPFIEGRALWGREKSFPWQVLGDRRLRDFLTFAAKGTCGGSAPALEVLKPWKDFGCFQAVDVERAKSAVFSVSSLT